MSMQKAKYVYVVYINTTPEKVWDAIGNPELTRKYWGNSRNVSDWKARSSKWRSRKPRRIPRSLK